MSTGNNITVNKFSAGGYYTQSYKDIFKNLTRLAITELVSKDITHVPVATSNIKAKFTKAYGWTI